MQEDFFSPLIDNAIELAAQWHAGTFRKGAWRNAPFASPTGIQPKIPAMAHVTAVALTVQRANWNQETVSAAFLHDILEDPNQFGQVMLFDELVGLMSLDIASLVKEVSEQKMDVRGKPQQWKARKIGYIEGLKNCSVEAAAISLADKIHNLWSMNETIQLGIDIFQTTDLRKGLSAGHNEQCWFYQSVYDATLHHGDSRLIPMHKRLMEEIQRFSTA